MTELINSETSSDQFHDFFEHVVDSLIDVYCAFDPEDRVWVYKEIMDATFPCMFEMMDLFTEGCTPLQLKGLAMAKDYWLNGGVNDPELAHTQSYMMLQLCNNKKFFPTGLDHIRAAQQFAIRTLLYTGVVPQPKMDAFGYLEDFFEAYQSFPVPLEDVVAIINKYFASIIGVQKI